jgi:O-antigen/teichoic acid export membrane protein
MLTISLPIILLNYYEYSSENIIVFAIAYSLLKYSGIILGPFMQLITPYFTPIKNNKKLVINYYKKFFLIILGISIIISSFLYYFSPYLINIFFDKKYISAIDIFKVLLLSIPFMFLNTYTIIVISSTQSIKITFKLSIIGFIFIFTSLMISMNLHYSLFVVSYLILIGYIFDLFISLYIFNKYNKGK